MRTVLITDGGGLLGRQLEPTLARLNLATQMPSMHEAFSRWALPIAAQPGPVP